MIPDSYSNDELYVYATEVQHDTTEGTWSIRVDPDSYLVGPEADLSVSLLRNEDLTRIELDSGYKYRGRILISAGVVTVINGNIILIERDRDAPSDPGKLQSPAGRCEGPPGHTAVREFYEELAILDEQQPILIQFDDSGRDYENVYESTLSRVGQHAPPSSWERYHASIPDPAIELAERIETLHGGRRYSDTMIAFFDEAASTLELRYVIETSAPNLSDLRFLDGEFDRDIRPFEPQEVVELDETDLVSTDTYLADTLYPQLAQ